jgi:hypothetical protein
MYIPSYGHPHTLGHKYLIHLFDDPVVIQEKVDGSQISFGVINGNLSVRSRGQDVTNDTTGMFSKAVKELQKRKDFMFEAAIYRGEYLQKPKHNKKTYSRIPKGNVILFDVEYPDGTFANPTTLLLEAHQLDLECVPTFYEGNAIAIQDMLPSYLTNESILGGTRIEGIVIKNYYKTDQNGKTLMGKLVSDEFKESMNTKDNVNKLDEKEIVSVIVNMYNKEARWSKAVQHLNENKELHYSDKDIGNLIREISIDFEKECQDEIKDWLYKKFRKPIIRGIVEGFATWYQTNIPDDN